jgi:hypothetical protein
MALAVIEILMPPEQRGVFEKEPGSGIWWIQFLPLPSRCCL